MISELISRFKRFYESKKAESLLPHAIITTPTKINKEDILPGVNFGIQYADDEKIVINRNSGFFNFLLMGGILTIAGIAIVIFVIDNRTLLVGLIFGLIGFPLLVGGIFSIFYAITEPRKNIIFNRKEQTVTFPGFLYSKPVTFFFKDMEAGINFTNVRFMPTGTYLIGGKPGKMGEPMVWARNLSFGLSEEKDWSFYVWYMDKNRPLPPGTAFDEFRERDDKRRKKEGNPPPLYPSYIYDEDRIEIQP